MNNEQLSRLYNDSARHENPGHLTALWRIYDAGQADGWDHGHRCAIGYVAVPEMVPEGGYKNPYRKEQTDA